MDASCLINTLRRNDVSGNARDKLWLGLRSFAPFLEARRAYWVQLPGMGILDTETSTGIVDVGVETPCEALEASLESLSISRISLEHEKHAIGIAARIARRTRNVRNLLDWCTILDQTRIDEGSVALRNFMTCLVARRAYWVQLPGMRILHPDVTAVEEVRTLCAACEAGPEDLTIFRVPEIHAPALFAKRARS